MADEAPTEAQPPAETQDPAVAAYLAALDLRNKIRERYPSWDWLFDEPEMRQLLERAITEEWTPELFGSQLQATNWWKSSNQARRQFFQLERSDPAEAASQVNAMKSRIAALGFQIGAQLDDNMQGSIAWQALRNGWSETQVRASIASIARPSTASTGFTDVKSLAERYMVDVTDDQATEWTRRIFAGELTEDGLRSLLGELASSRMPSMAEWISKGVTPGDYFAPYRQMIGQLTDSDPNTIDLLRDSTWSQIMSKPDDKTGALRPMTLNEAQRFIRGTQQFLDSRTGQSEMASYEQRFAKALGMRV